MPNIALFVPDNIMYTQAQEIINSNKNLHISVLKQTSIENVTNEAIKAIDDGANIIIARGRQAIELSNNTNVTVTNIIMTSQEIGLLVLKAKKLISKKRITIGLFGFGNMIADTSHFDKLYDVNFKRYNLSEDEEWRNVVLNCKNDGIDIIIGERSILECASHMEIPCIYLEGTGESILNAINHAESLYKMAELERRNYAQYSTVLDSATNGIITLSKSGRILVANRTMEEIIGQNMHSLTGTHIQKLFKDLNCEPIDQVINGEIENYTSLFTYEGQALVITVEPMIFSNEIEYVVISFNRLSRRDIIDSDSVSKKLLSGYVAYANFDDIEDNMIGLRKTIEQAKLFSLSSSPMLIESFAVPELDIITQSIHNYGMRKNGPFIMINIAGMSESEQERVLFGDINRDEDGAILNADKGTLVIQSIDKLSLPMQYNLIRAIRTKRLSIVGQANHKVFDTRIIGCTAKHLREQREKFLFRSDLFFTLNSLRLKIPNLKDRPEDVEYLLDTYFKQYMKHYSRYHVLSSGARNILTSYKWEGNSIQIQSFCERMILTAKSRIITEKYVLSLLDELYNDHFGVYDYETDSDFLNMSTTSDPMADLIHKTLIKYNGNKKLTANELKISTTTLWRKIKKYGL